MIAIIDYDAGNLRSVQKAFQFIGAEAVLTSDAAVILAADAVVLPGVGAFKDCMDSLKRKNLQDTVRQAVRSGKPFLGICLGFQMLFDESEEHSQENGGNVPGLGIYRGVIRRLQLDPSLKVPHMGWNCLEGVGTEPLQGRGNPLFVRLPDQPYVYFVHSFYVDCTETTLVSARTTYGKTFDVSLWDGNVFATQFHPEKSGEVGLQMLRNFVRIVNAK